MTTDFTGIQAVRQRFGGQLQSDEFPSEKNAPFVGLAKDFVFACPNIAREERGLRQLQSLGIEAGFTGNAGRLRHEFQSRHRRVFALALGLALAACASSGGGDGGGAGGGSGGAGGGGGPQPNPGVPGYSVTSAPEAATTGTNTTAQVVSSASSPNFFDKGALDGTSFPLLQTAVTVTIDPNGKSPLAAAAATNASGATLVYGGEDDTGLQVPSLGNIGTPQTGTGGTIGLSLSLPTSVQADASLAYVLPGAWFVNANGAATFSVFVTGLETASGAIPLAGSATYYGYSSGFLFTPTRSATLFGEATLTANFGTGALTGSVTDVFAHDGNVTDGYSNDIALSATILSGSNAFSGTADAGQTRTSELSVSGSATGTIEGAFYGPNAQELGAVWTLSDGTNVAIGSIGATSAAPATVGAPAAPSRGTNPSPVQTATIGGANFGRDGPYPSNVTFALTSTSLDFTAAGISAASNTQSATALVKSSSPTLSEIELVIPALSIDTTISIPRPQTPAGNLAYTSTDYSYGKVGVLSYVSLGVWGESGGAFGRAGSITAFAFGYETLASALPATGKAEYAGNGLVAGRVFVPQDGGIGFADLGGSAQLTADFATGKIDGVLNVEVEYGWDVPGTWHDVSVAANIAGGTNRFSGTTAVTSSSTSPYTLKSSATGVIDGAFYGPDGENLGAVWTLSDGIGSAIGVVGAQRQ